MLYFFRSLRHESGPSLFTATCARRVQCCFLPDHVLHPRRYRNNLLGTNEVRLHTDVELYSGLVGLAALVVTGGGSVVDLREATGPGQSEQL